MMMPSPFESTGALFSWRWLCVFPGLASFRAWGCTNFQVTIYIPFNLEKRRGAHLVTVPG